MLVKFLIIRNDFVATWCVEGWFCSRGCDEHCAVVAPFSDGGLVISILTDQSGGVLRSRPYGCYLVAARERGTAIV